jgi:predicted PurR-regulated permease PerM
LNAESIRRFRFAPLLTATVLTVLLLWLFGRVADVFLLLFLGILISLYLGAVARFFEHRFHLPDRLAFALALILTVSAVGVLFWILVPPVFAQTQQLVRVLPNYIAAWEEGIERAVSRVPALREVWGAPGQHKILRAVYDEITSSFSSVVPKVFGVVQIAIKIFSVAVMGIYLALYPSLYREWVIALFPPLHRDLVRDVLADLADTLRSYIVAQLLTMGFLATLTAIGLYFLGVPFSLTFGIFTGLAAIVPFFGTLLSTTLPALFVLNTPGGGTKALLVIGLGVVIHLIEGNIVSPLVMSRRVDLPPVLTIMSVLVIGELLGGVGLLVAVPTLAALMVVVRRILITRIYEGQGFRRTTRERPLVLRLPVPGGGVLVPSGPAIDIITLVERKDLTRSA